MATTTSNARPLLADALADLIVEPVTRDALALDPRIATTMQIGTHDVRIPKVVEDPTAGWVAEGAEIPSDDGVLAEITATPSKIAALTVISREAANDSSPAAAEMIGNGLARSIAAELDKGLFGVGGTGPVPAGLGALPVGGAEGVQSVMVVGDVYEDLDPFRTAVSLVSQTGTEVTAFVCHPMTALALSRIREGEGSNRGLLDSDPAAPTSDVINGRPLITSPHVPATDGTVWALPADRVITVLREGAEVESDSSAFFTSDRIALRGIMRATYAFPSPRSLVRITTGA